MLQTGAGSRLRAKTNALRAFGGLTFAKDYSLMPQGEVSAGVLVADHASGSSTATITASRGSSNPATYIDHNGIIRLVTNSNVGRKTAGFYDSTGFVSRPGLIVEGASTNLLTNTDGTDYTNWSYGEDVTGSKTVTQNDASSITGIVGATYRRVRYTGIVTDTNKSLSVFAPQTGVASVAPGDVITESIYARTDGGQSGVNIVLAISWRNSSGSLISETTQSITLTSSWKRFTVTGTAPALTDRIIFKFLCQQVDNGDVVDYSVIFPQAEKLPFASTFIPTTTAALTRNAEGLSYLNSGNRTANTESIFIKYSPFFGYATTIPTDAYLFQNDLSGGGRNIRKATSGIVNRITFNAASAYNANTGPAINTSSVLGVTFNGATASPNVIAYYNGVADGNTDTNYTAPTFGTNFYVGGVNAINSQLNGSISFIAIFSDAKSAADVLAISNLMAGA